MTGHIRGIRSVEKVQTETKTGYMLRPVRGEYYTRFQVEAILKKFADDNNLDSPAETVATFMRGKR